MVRFLTASQDQASSIKILGNCVDMKFPKRKTFRDAMSPVIFAGSALGIRSFEYSAGRPRRVLSLCWSGTCLILVFSAVGTSALTDLWDVEQSTILGITLRIFIIVNTACGIAFMYFGQARSKIFMDSLCKLDRVNEMMNKFRIPNEYESISKSQIIHLIRSFIFMLTMAPFFNQYSTQHITVVRISYFITMYYILMVSILEDFTFSTCVGYIGNRFRRLNALLMESSIRKRNATHLFQNFLSDRHISTLEIHVQSQYVGVKDKQCMMNVLRNAIKIHSDLRSIAENLNEAFGVQIVITMIMAPGIIIVILYTIYTVWLNSNKNLNNMTIHLLAVVPYIVFYAMKVLRIVSACAMTASEAQQTGRRIHQLVRPTSCKEIRREIHAFSLQLMHKPLEFKACRFLTLDHTMIRAMVETVTTYLVIMIQMPDTSDMAHVSTNVTVPATNTTD